MTDIMGNDVDQLVDIYSNKESWRKEFLSQDDIRQYFADVMRKNRIVVVKDGDEVTGYAESWRINKTQLFRYVSGQPFHVGEEDIETGGIVYISSVWAKDTKTFRRLVRSLKDQNNQCGHTAWHKRNDVLKIFKLGGYNGK